MMQLIARGVTHEQAAELANLFHLARTALAGAPDAGRYERKLWAAKMYAAKHGVSESCAYKMLDRVLA